jgi:hypothetical protein
VLGNRYEGQKLKGIGHFLNKALWTFMVREGNAGNERFQRDFEPE